VTYLNTVIFSALAVAGLTGAIALPANAATTGVFVGTFGGNDPFPGAIFPGTGNESVALYKCDDIEEGIDPFCVDENASAGDYASSFTITFDDFKDQEEAIGGTWAFTLGSNTLLPKYIALKAGTNYSVWDIGGLSFGDWSTVETLGSKGISHISFYDSYTAPVPLPAAGLLLVGAVGGLAALRRRKARA